MINSAGFKIWPREVEEVLYQHRSVFECAVVACQRRQGRSGRRLRARKPRATLALGELEAFYRARLATFIIPREFAFMDDIPKNATGTILKRVLRDQFAQDAEARRAIRSTM